MEEMDVNVITYINFCSTFQILKVFALTIVANISSASNKCFTCVIV